MLSCVFPGPHYFGRCFGCGGWSPVSRAVVAVGGCWSYLPGPLLWLWWLVPCFSCRGCRVWSSLPGLLLWLRVPVPWSSVVVVVFTIGSLFLGSFLCVSLLVLSLSAAVTTVY